MTTDQQYNALIERMKRARRIVDSIDRLTDDAYNANRRDRGYTLSQRAKIARRAYNNAADEAARLLRRKCNANARYKAANANRLYRYTYRDFVYTEAYI